MFFNKVYTRFRCFQPFGTFLNVIVGKRANISESSLKPNGFGSIHQTAVAIQASVKPPVDLIHPVLKPEWHNVSGQFLFIYRRVLFNILSVIRSHSAYNLLHLLKKLIASSSSLISCSSSSVTTLNGVRFGPRSRPMSFIILFPPTIFPPCLHITLMTS